MVSQLIAKRFLVQKIGGRGQRHSIYYCQGWLSNKIKEQLRRPNESLSSVLEFKEFVAFLLDKEGAFEQVKRDFNASFYFMDDHWSSYYKQAKREETTLRTFISHPTSYCSTCELRPELILELSELAIELPVLVQRSGLGRCTHKNIPEYFFYKYGSERIILIMQGVPRLPPFRT